MERRRGGRYVEVDGFALRGADGAGVGLDLLRPAGAVQPPVSSTRSDVLLLHPFSREAPAVIGPADNWRVRGRWSHLALLVVRQRVALRQRRQGRRGDHGHGRHDRYRGLTRSPAPSHGCRASYPAIITLSRWRAVDGDDSTGRTGPVL